MPRINVDDELRSDPRFINLCGLIKRHEAFGALICLWENGQAYWKKNKSLIPKNLFDMLPFASDLLRCGFVTIENDGIYCIGARERWGFLLVRSEVGKIGGLASAEARRQKYGTSIPINATNSEAKSEQKTEANRSKPKHSSSSSSSNIKSMANLKVSPEDYFSSIDEKMTEWKKSFPLIDIPSEIEKMKAWLKANPTRRKKNYDRFVVNWLSRCKPKEEQKKWASGPFKP